MSKKKTTIPVHSMGHLFEVINHNADVAERAFRNLKVLCILAIGSAVYTTIKTLKQEEQIYQLSVRINKMECNKGE